MHVEPFDAHIQIVVDPKSYPSIRLWMRAIRSLEGFIEMPGIHRLHELKPDPHETPSWTETAEA